MRRNLFFDVDGTLIPFGGSVSEDTKEALAEAKRRGHRLFLATGRSPAELDPRLSGIPFDGGVYSGGARAIVEGEDIYASYFAPEVLDYYIKESLAHGWRIMAQTDERSYSLGDFDRVVLEIFMRHIGVAVKIENVVKVDSFDGIGKVTKLILLTPDGDMDVAHSLFDSKMVLLNNTVGVPRSLMAEVCQKGVDKGRAMEAVLDHLGETRESAIAFGDGSNDHEIIRAAGIGVAMGNAEEPLKEIADYVTEACEKDGIGKALRRFGVI